MKKQQTSMYAKNYLAAITAHHKAENRKNALGLLTLFGMMVVGLSFGTYLVFNENKVAALTGAFVCIGSLYPIIKVFNWWCP